MIKLLINGLPGKMATEVLRVAGATSDIDIVSFSFTGSEINDDVFPCWSVPMPDAGRINLIQPRDRKRYMPLIHDSIRHQEFVTLDFTHPSATADNIKFYCEHDMPFIMGTTGVDMEAGKTAVESSNISAVIAPNMCKQVVALQAMMQYAAQNFPKAFGGFTLRIIESHQKGKADTSGTAKAMIGYFNLLGIPFTKEQIVMVREPQEQLAMGIPEEALDGHGWHTYALCSEDGSILFKFTHNINGRMPYVMGALDAVRFLHKKISTRDKGHLYSMIDVLQNK